MISALLIHDRGTTAWIIVAFYFAGTAAAFWASRGAPKRDRRFWLGTGILLALLGLNKELDLQTLLTGAARYLAHYAGWYDQRRLVQGAFLLALAVGVVLAVAALLRSLRRSARPMKAAAAGIGLLALFVVMRAASFHHIDDWVMINVAGLRRGWWIELAGIAVIAASALAYRKRPRPKSR